MVEMSFWLERAEKLREADAKRREQLPDLNGTTNILDCWRCKNYAIRPTGPGMGDEWECLEIACPVCCPAAGCEDCENNKACSAIDSREAKLASRQAWAELQSYLDPAWRD